MSPIKLSAAVFSSSASDFAALAEHAETVGFEAIWLAEHVVTPDRSTSVYPYAAGAAPAYDPRSPLNDTFSTLAYAAARTASIHLGTGVYLLPLRHPLLTARAASTVQELSQGRLVLGVGTGWMREEYAALGADFATRGVLADECLAVLRTVWAAGGPVGFAGEHVGFDPLHFNPSHAEPIPIVVGGTSAPALRRAATHGDGWYGPLRPLEEAVATRARLEELREQAGTSGGPFRYYPRLFDDPSAGSLAAYADAGFDHLVIGLGANAGLAATSDRRRRLDHCADLLSRL